MFFKLEFKPGVGGGFLRARFIRRMILSDVNIEHYEGEPGSDIIDGTQMTLAPQNMTTAVKPCSACHEDKRGPLPYPSIRS